MTPHVQNAPVARLRAPLRMTLTCDLPRHLGHGPHRIGGTV